MHKFIRKAIALALAAALWAPTTLALAMDPIMPLAKVQPGMVGTAYTVVDHTGELKDFRVDIIGNIDNGKGSTPMIMAKASGPVIDAVGGILQGMSGSPVYVDGYLVGAVAAGIKEMTPYTFFITPIEEMTPLWSMPDRKNKTRIKTIDLKKFAADKEKAKKEAAEKAAKDKGLTAEEIAGASAAAEKLAANAEESPAEQATEQTTVTAAEDEKNTDDWVQAKPAEVVTEEKAPAEEGKLPANAEPKTNLYFAGFNQPSLDYLQQQLDPQKTMNFLPMGAPTSAANHETHYDATLAPGAPVGVAVTYGDFAVGATGTVTAVDGQNILAFGHPFLHRGNVNYFMTDASIVGTISGQSNGMKMANIGSIIGRINQDRSTGVAGALGVFPSVVPVKVHVKDNAIAREESYGARIAYDEDLLGALSGGIAYAAMSKTSDNLSGSTANLQFTIRTNAVPSGKIVRSNMFYNTADVGQIAVTELVQAMNTICTAPEKEADIIDVQVDINVEGGRRTATILSAVPSKKTVSPGETIRFTTTIKPYRRDKETVIIPFTVPEDQPSGALALDVRGGGLVPVTSLMLLQQSGVDVTTEESAKQTTADKLQKLQESGRNNEIVIAPQSKQLSEKEQRRILREAEKIAAAKKNAPHKAKLLDSDKKKPAGKASLATNYIIENVIHTVLEVKR